MTLLESSHQTGSKTLVVGAGITGLRIALNLAGIGCDILLADRAPHTGGLLNYLEKQFPTDHCGLCRILPDTEHYRYAEGCLRRGLIHERVEFLPQAEVIDIDGPSGDLAVTLNQTPPGVVPGICTGCGKCETVCPESAPDPFMAGLKNRPAIYSPYPFSPFGPRVIDWSACTKCGACVSSCPTSAVNLEDRARKLIYEGIPRVILATGRPLYDPGSVDYYGYHVLPRVVTALEYERIASPSGPYGGDMGIDSPLWPTNGSKVKKVAWVQCVGSRNLNIEADYCSRVCCMFALKEAGLLKEKAGDRVDAAVFYMDLRTYHRDFQRYGDHAQNELGVRLIRSRVHSLDPNPEDGRIIIRYMTQEGGPGSESFDLVVLSNGQDKCPADPVVRFREKPGVFTADSSLELTDISESIISADALTGRVLTGRVLAEHGKTMPTVKRPEPEAVESRTATSEPRTLAVFLTDGLVNPDLRNMEYRLPENSIFAVFGITPDFDLIGRLEEKIGESEADRLLLLTPGPGPVPYPPSTLAARLGLASNMVEVLSHGAILSEAEGSEDTSRRLLSWLRREIGLLGHRTTAVGPTDRVHTGVLVVGGGPAGLAAALMLAQNGVEVDLVEKEDRVGWTADRLADAGDRVRVEALLEEVEKSSRIEVHTQTTVSRVGGFSGAFQIRLSGEGRPDTRIRPGAVILATGGRKVDDNRFFTENHPAVRPVHELNFEDLRANPPREAVFILCAGTRFEPRNYCSRVCCVQSLRAALEIKKAGSESAVTIFYRDIMTYGESERLYTQTRRAGVRFVSYPDNAPPAIAFNGREITVSGYDPLLAEPVTLNPDLLALAQGVEPNPNQDIFRRFELSTDADGFVKEADVKWRPLDSNRPGVFLCGLNRAPARLEEALRHGRAAAARALSLLMGREMNVPGNTACIKPGRCARCLVCLPACPYQARRIDPRGGPIVVDTAACRGCGLCVAVCPAGAIELPDLNEHTMDFI